jgi:hypothetical protein
VLAGLARDAADEVQLAVQSNFRFLNSFHRVQHRRHGSFLLARALAEHRLAGEPVRRRIDDGGRIRVGHGVGRLVHRVRDQHHRTAAAPAAFFCYQVAHRVEAYARHAERLHAWNERRLHELAQLRLVLEEIGLRRGHAHQLLENGARARHGQVRRQAFPDRFFRHSAVKETCLHTTSQTQ